MNFEGSHWDDCWRSHHECAIAEVERLRAELEAAKTRIAELEEAAAKAAEHYDTAPHEGCTCQICTLMERNHE